MSKFKRVSTISLLIASFAFADSSNYASYLSSKTFSVSGTFGAYDFSAGYSQGADAFDWAFVSSGVVFQLQGNTPSDNNVFGWKAATISADTITPAWYMFSTSPDDLDGDGSAKFDWLLVSPNTQMTLKLEGVTEQGTFQYSNPISVEYTIASNGASVTFSGEAAISSSASSSSTSTKLIWFDEERMSEEQCIVYADYPTNNYNYHSGESTCMFGWKAAKEYCSNKGGSLPTLAQLQAAHEACKQESGTTGDSCIPDGFINDGWGYGYYWSSDIYDDSYSYAFNFSSGVADTYNIGASALYVRCVQQ